jgi:hypothetical protein
MTSKLVFKSRRATLGLAVLFIACGGGGGGSESAGQTDGGSSSTAAASTTDGPSTTSSASATSNSGTGTDGMTTTPTTDPTTTATATSSTTNTTDTTTTVGETTGTTSTTGSTGPIEESTGTTDPIEESTGGSGTTGPDCVPSPEVCNDLDDDCDDIVDNVDVGNDGICDCLNIALFGTKGSNPASEFETWLEMQGTQVDRIQLDNTPLTPQIVDKYDIIILDRLVRTYAPDEAALMESWVTGGGGLMSMTGYTGGPPDVQRPNSIIGPMGLTYNNSKGIISGPVTQWTMHPITEGITSVTFLGGFYIDIVDDGIAVNTVVGTLPQGPVAVAQVRKNGKLFIWGDEWIEFDSEWQNQPQIKKFWANILGWLSPQNFCTIPQ